MDFDCFNCDVSRVISQYPALLNEITNADKKHGRFCLKAPRGLKN